jgi:hypothetical protein
VIYLQSNHHRLCQGCIYDAKTLCLSKIKKKALKYRKHIEGSDVIFRMIYCGERKAVQAGTS